jgi:hypothetical protein
MVKSHLLQNKKYAKPPGKWILNHLSCLGSLPKRALRPPRLSAAQGCRTVASSPHRSAVFEVPMHVHYISMVSSVIEGERRDSESERSDCCYSLHVVSRLNQTRRKDVWNNLALHTESETGKKN